MNQVTEDMVTMYRQSKSYYTRGKLQMNMKMKRRKGLLFCIAVDIGQTLREAIANNLKRQVGCWTPNPNHPRAGCKCSRAIVGLD